MAKDTLFQIYLKPKTLDRARYCFYIITEIYQLEIYGGIWGGKKRKMYNVYSSSYSYYRATIDGMLQKWVNVVWAHLQSWRNLGMREGERERETLGYAHKIVPLVQRLQGLPCNNIKFGKKLCFSRFFLHLLLNNKLCLLLLCTWFTEALFKWKYFASNLLWCKLHVEQGMFSVKGNHFFALDCPRSLFVLWTANRLFHSLISPAFATLRSCFKNFDNWYDWLNDQTTLKSFRKIWKQKRTTLQV